MKFFEKINPAIKASPLMILLTMLVPQVLLALFRCHTLWLIHEEMHDHVALIYANYLAVPLALAGVALGLLLWSRRSEGDLPRWSMLGVFLLQTAGLVFFLLSMDHLLPLGIDNWIVPAGPFIMLQLGGSMPGLFYSLICLANIRLFKKTWVNITTSFGLLVTIPTVLYMIMISSFSWGGSGVFVVTLFVVSTLIAAFTFLQLLLWLSGFLQYRWIPVVLFALVFPVGGMLLNRAIPFPADLQHWGFYALTLANAAILLWGCHPAARRTPLCALATAFSYPFTCYFFFLFLPFLPFSLIAMIAAGAGFLILTPVVLFILHTRQLVLMFKTQAERYGTHRIATGFLVAFLLVPASYFGRALIHRQIFFQTLDRVYASAVDTPTPMPSPSTAGYVLKRLHASKEGIYVPILSETYNRIVFGGMVLPDQKIKQLDQLLLGGTFGEVESFNDIQFYSFFTGDSMRSAGRNIRPPSRDVSLSDVECTAQIAGGVTETSILLTLQNHGDARSEYVTDIEIPEGIFVSGYELKIGDEMVPARLSDRRAALWVYHMIRDNERRDPGLVVFTRPNTLHLSVFPFAEDEERQCTLKLLYPENAAPEIRIGDRVVALPHGDASTISVCTPAGNQAVYIPAASAGKFPGIVRTPQRIELTGTPDTPGYCAEWDVKKALLAYWDSGDNQFQTVPWFVTNTEQPLVKLDSAAYWLPLIPDGNWSDQPPAPTEVIPFQCGNQIRVVPVQRGGIAVFSAKDSVTYFDGEQTRSFEAETLIDAETRYAQAINLWQLWWQTQLHPELEDAMRRELLSAARELNILIPSTAFLAAESSAQSKALKDAEDKSLNSNKNLAFDEFDSEEEMGTPEPSLLLLVILAFPLLHWMQKRNNRHENI